jgi:L,D-transpeptidase YbiS
MRAELRRRLGVAGTAAIAVIVAGLWATSRSFVPITTATAAEPLTSLVKGAPRGTYIVVDRGNNRLHLRSRDEIVLDAVVSTGSGAVLHEPGPEGRTWQFATPAGRFRVLDERVDPVWVRPDWAFVEEGLPIPERTADRRDPGALGEYALGLGDGYLIHGTLYERLIGRPVSHGCIRVGREPLREIYRAARIGTPVYIY